MNWWMMVGEAVGGVCLMAVVYAGFKSGRPIRNGLRSATQGVAGLLVVHLVSAYSGVGLGLGWLSLGISVVLGLPGVVALLLVNAVLR